MTKKIFYGGLLGFLFVVTPCAEATDQKELDAIAKLLYERKYGEAMPVLRKMLDENPRDARVWRYYGEGLDGITESKKAITAYTQAVTLGSKDWQVPYGRGMAYSHLGNFESAVADMKAAIKIGIPHPESRAAVHA